MTSGAASVSTARQTPLERRVRRVVAVVGSDRGARWAFAAAVVAAVAVYYVVGRQQWFTRDDWASIITREHVRRTMGWQHWLFDPQDGHWLTIPFLIFHALHSAFGLGSYWPFLLPALAAHVAAVFLVRVLCCRHGISAWTTTLVCTLLLMFGAGWENLVFAIQICYNLSLVAFLAQVVLVDHEGPANRRDAAGAVIAVVGVMSSGFGPIFLVGVLVLLALRQRWRALLVAVVPQGLAYGWWLVTWSSDRAADLRPGNRSQLPSFVVRGIGATFEALTSLPGLAGIAIVATVVVTMQPGNGRRTQTLMLALGATVLVMFGAIGFQRLGFGVPFAASSRYVHVAALVIAPAFALMVDRLGRINAQVRLAGLVVVVIAIGVNLSVMREATAAWARSSTNERQVVELILGSTYASTIDPAFFPFPNSPDLTIGSLDSLVVDGAFHPRALVTDADQQRVLHALRLSAPP